VKAIAARAGLPRDHQVARVRSGSLAVSDFNRWPGGREKEMQGSSELPGSNKLSMQERLKLLQKLAG